MHVRCSFLFRSLLTLLLLISTPLMALKAPDQGASVVEAEKPSQPPAAEAAIDPGSTVKKPAAPRPSNGGFVPSERIKAGSVVSFPVDI